MGQVYAMGDPKRKSIEITETDPFINVYDDGSFDKKVVFNNKEEAIEAVPQKWRTGTQTIRVSELSTLTVPKPK